MILRRFTIAALTLLSFVLVAGLVAVLGAISPAHGWSAFLAGMVLAGLSAAVLRIRLQREAARVALAVRQLPELAPEIEATAPEELRETFAEVRLAAERMQRALTAAGSERQQLEALLNSMQDAVVAVDASQRILWTNMRMRRMLPRVVTSGSDTAQARAGHALVHAIRDPEVLACIRVAIEQQVEHERRSTTMFPGRIYEVSASPMPGGGAVAVLHDVTRVEEVERTQRDFVANVSHELRTPLTSITGYVETLLDHESSISPQAREFLETILKNATRMTRLTEDLLAMAKVESPAGAGVALAVPAAALVQDAVASISGLLQETGTTVVVAEATATPVLANSDAILQVLGNLIENAAKYGQPLDGSVARIVLRARDAEEGTVEFSVQDFGGGIASQHLTRIFERFYRVDKTRSRDSGGTGLGLAIARHIVLMHGGSIRAESQLQRGTTFSFTLPAALEASAAPEPIQPSAPVTLP